MPRPPHRSLKVDARIVRVLRRVGRGAGGGSVFAPEFLDGRIEEDVAVSGGGGGGGVCPPQKIKRRIPRAHHGDLPLHDGRAVEVREPATRAQGLEVLLHGGEDLFRVVFDVDEEDQRGVGAGVEDAVTMGVLGVAVRAQGSSLGVVT